MYRGTVYQFITDGPARQIDVYAHNVVAQPLVEFGVAGAASFVFVVAVFLLALRRNRAEFGAADVLLLGWLGILGIHSLLEYPLWYVHFLIFFDLSLGLLIRPAWCRTVIRVPMRWLAGGCRPWRSSSLSRCSPTIISSTA